MIRRPPTPTRTDTPLPYTPLFRSAPEQHRRARKTPTIGDTHLRDQGAQASLQGEGAGVEHPAPGHPVGIARAPAAALGEIDHRQAPLLGEFKEPRSEEHTSELQSLMRISYAVFCLKKKKYHNDKNIDNNNENDYHKTTKINTSCVRHQMI